MYAKGLLAIKDRQLWGLKCQNTSAGEGGKGTQEIRLQLGIQRETLPSSNMVILLYN